MAITLDDITAAIAATGALGAAAAGLVDAAKACGGRLADVGFAHIRAGCAPFASLMQRGAGGADWTHLLRAHWRDGRPREVQIALARTLVRLGLGAPGPMPPLPGIDAHRLDQLSTRLRAGETPDDHDTDTLARIDAMLGLAIEAAYARATHRYRNVARLLAGCAALCLAMLANVALGLEAWRALIVGLVAAPLAPLAKDLVSSLSAAALAMKAARA